VICGKPVNIADFKDPISLREFEIGGSCQSCQDKIYEEEK